MQTELSSNGVMTDVSSAGVRFDFKPGGPWDAETVCVLYRTPEITDEQIEATKQEIERHVSVYDFEVIHEA